MGNSEGSAEKLWVLWFARAPKYHFPPQARDFFSRTLPSLFFLTPFEAFRRCPLGMVFLHRLMEFETDTLGKPCGGFAALIFDSVSSRFGGVC